MGRTPQLARRHEMSRRLKTVEGVCAARVRDVKAVEDSEAWSYRAEVQWKKGERAKDAVQETAHMAAAKKSGRDC